MPTWGTLKNIINPSCTSEKETPYEDNKYYFSDCFVLLQVLENKHSETYKIEGLACMTSPAQVMLPAKTIKKCNIML